MTVRVMRRKASDNEYLHPDFHGALSAGIDYLHRTYGPRAVRDYLRAFARRYYAPVTEALRREGLPALKRHIAALYRREKAPCQIRLTRDELVVTVPACPAVTHMRRRGYPVARLFHETTRTVNAVLCEGTPFRAELTAYDPETGRSVQRFYRRGRR